MTKWQYNKETDVYWQTGVVYCASPADEAYENLGIYVPGAYMSGTDNGDGTYTCETLSSGMVGGFTAKTAPIVLPVDTPGYSAMAAPAGYVSNTSVYTDAGFVYVYAGCRGRDAGAPAGVTDLKAAIRYMRYVGDAIPGSTERIFTFGMSGGGAQSALLGATGDSELYTPYLEAIGAVSGVSDAVEGTMAWCPITNLDYASEAYEWNLGITRSGLSEDMQELSLIRYHPAGKAASEVRTVPPEIFRAEVQEDAAIKRIFLILEILRKGMVLTGMRLPEALVFPGPTRRPRIISML